MSTWHDLIDDSSVQRFVAGNDVPSSNGSNASNADASAEHGGATATEAPPAEVLYETELLDASTLSHEGERSSPEEGGITIVSSVPSSNDVHNLIPPPENLPEQNRSGAMEDVSWMAEESVSLSLHPSSVDSSIVTEFTEESSRMMASVSEISESSIDDDHRSMDEGSASETSPSGISPSAENQLKLWYGRLQTDQDWNEFRASAVELLNAMDCPAADRDELLAQLIAAEEEAFWGQEGRAAVVVQQPKYAWLWELAAVTAGVAVSSVALVRMLKGRS